MSLYWHENAEGFGKRISEHAGLTETFFEWISILYLGSGCLYQYDRQAFLFSLVNKPGWAPVKFNQTGKHSSHESYSTYSCNNLGPIFGGKDRHDLKLGHVPHYSYSDLGYTYGPPSGHIYASPFARTFLAGHDQFNPDEIETFYDVAITSQGRFEDKLASLYIIYNFPGILKNDK